MQHVSNGCLSDPGVIFAVDARGSVVMARGTNKLERYHRAYNAVIPQSCSMDTYEAVPLAFNCAWNCNMGVLHEVDSDLSLFPPFSSRPSSPSPTLLF